MDRLALLIEKECDLFAIRIRIAELELELIDARRAQRTAATGARQQQLEAAAAEVKGLEQALAAEMAKVSPEKPGAAQASHATAPTPLPQRQPAPKTDAPAATVNPQETWPDGTDLGQPRTFGVRPPADDLEPHGASSEEFQRRLKRHLDFATNVLHTSGVVAVVWREWRAFERAVQEQLRTLNAAPASRV